MQEQIAVQATQPMQSMRAKFAANTLGGQQGGDPFAMIFAQMMGGEEGEGLLDMLLGQLGQGVTDPKQEQSMLGGALAAESMLMQPQFMQMLMQTDPQAQAQTLQLLAQAAGVNLPTQLDAQNSLAQLEAQTARQATEAGWLTQALEASAQATEQAVPGQQGVTKQFHQMLADAWHEPSAEVKGDQEGQLAYENAVRQIRQSLSQKPKEQQTIDLNALDGALSAKRFVPQAATGTQQTQTLPDAQQIADQLKSGILEQTAKGKSEFVVKLKPDGLGEITVRLSERENKISLSIVTSSAQVAKLIANDIQALQNALRPLHAEVQQVVTTPAGHTQAYTDGQATFAQQGFDGRGHQQQSNQPNQYYYRSDTGEEEFQTAAQILPELDGLNAYI